MRNRLIKCCSSVLGGFLTHLVMGAFYLWGNISLYVASYYRYHGYPKLATSTVQAVFPFIYFGICTGHFIGINCARKYGHKLISGIAMVFYVTSYYLSTFSNFYAFVLFMGFLPGICIGTEYIVPVDNAYFFYPARKGLIGGLILCGLGFGSLVFNPILQVLINPDNESTLADGYYSQTVADRLPRALQIVTIIYLCLGLLGVLLMFQTKKYSKMEQQLSKTLVKSKSSLNNSDDNNAPEIKITKAIQAFSHRELYIIWILFYTTSGFGLMMASQYKQYGIKKIDDDNFFAIVGSVGGVANGLSRFFWAFLLDYISPDILIPINSVIMIILAATFDSVAESKTCFMLWMIFVYIQYGGLYTFYPTLCVRIFGRSLGLHVYNITFTAVMCSNFTQFALTKLYVPTIGYSNIFYIYCGFGGVALVTHFINLYFKRNPRHSVSSS